MCLFGTNICHIYDKPIMDKKWKLSNSIEFQALLVKSICKQIFHTKMFQHFASK